MTNKLPKVMLTTARTLLFSAAGLLICSLPASGAEGDVKWRTGVEFRQQLEAPVGLAWTSNPLRSGLQKLARQQQVAIFLDRRIDPDQRVDFTSDNLPLEDLFERLAKQLKIGSCRLGSVVYVGPVETTKKLATVAALRRAEVAALPGEVRQRMVSTQSWNWESLAEPRELLSKVIDTAQCTATASELAKVPHDLWPGVELPALPWSDRVTLLLAGFDLTFQVSKDGSAIRFGRIPDVVRYSQTYPPRGELQKLVVDLRKKYPQAEIEHENGKLSVSGSFEDHELIERLLRGERIRKTQVVDGPTKISLTVERQPLGPVMKALAEQLMLEVEIAPEIANRANELISFQIKNASLKELLEALATAAKVSYTLNGNKVRLAAP